MGGLPGVKNSAEMNRPQAGGYSICEIALGPQMLREPLGGGLRRAVELVGVSREVTAGVELQLLRLAGAVERRQGEVGGADDVDLLSVRRPRRRVIFVTAERELAHVTAMTRAVRIHHMHLHSAMPARDEHNLSRIRRPERLVINHPREGAEFFDRKIVRARAGDDG